MTQKKRKTYKPQLHKKRFDFALFFTVIFLSLFGVLIVYDASVVEAYRDFSDKFHFARLQGFWVALGIVSMLIASFIPLKLIKKITPIILLSSIGFLVAVLIPGIGTQIQGARRWIKLGFFSVQPSELAKLGFVLYLSSWLENKQRLVHFLFLIAIILSLVMLQPDLGTSIVLVTTGLTMYFLSGASITTLLIVAAIGFVSGLTLILSSPYRKARLLTFLQPQTDPLGASYHIRQVLIALGSGGLFGVGIGRSRQKYEYLPEATTDSIFAVMAEEIGFIGSAVVIALLLLVIYRGFKIARNASEPFNQLLAGGITSWIGIQVFLNLSAMVALVPLTGIPLPFFSYGGSSTISILAGIGLLLNISKQK